MRKNVALEPRGEWFELTDERIGLLASTEDHAWERVAEHWPTEG